jgi:hypothetical protein
MNQTFSADGPAPGNRSWKGSYVLQDSIQSIPVNIIQQQSCIDDIHDPLYAATKGVVIFSLPAKALS